MFSGDVLDSVVFGVIGVGVFGFVEVDFNGVGVEFMFVEVVVLDVGRVFNGFFVLDDDDDDGDDVDDGNDVDGLRVDIIEFIFVFEFFF